MRVRAAAMSGIRIARAQGLPCREQRIRQRPEPRRQQALQPQAQRLGQTRRGAARANRQQHRRAINDGGGGEIAKVGPVDDIHQQPGGAQAGRIGGGAVGIRTRRGVHMALMGDKGQPGPLRQAGGDVVQHQPPRPLHQPALGHGALARAQHDHRLPGDAVEQGQWEGHG